MVIVEFALLAFLLISQFLVLLWIICINSCRNDLMAHIGGTLKISKGTLITFRHVKDSLLVFGFYFICHWYWQESRFQELGHLTSLTNPDFWDRVLDLEQYLSVEWRCFYHMSIIPNSLGAHLQIRSRFPNLYITRCPVFSSISSSKTYVQCQMVVTLCNVWNSSWNCSELKQLIFSFSSFWSYYVTNY